MLPSPPITVAIKPFIVKGRINKGEITPTAAAARHPARPPKTPARKKVDALTLCGFIPQRMAAFICCETALAANRKDIFLGGLEASKVIRYRI